MMRCRACDAVMFPSEIKFNKNTGQHEELCRICIAAVITGDGFIPDATIPDEDGDGEPISPFESLDVD